jgi:hypothetical protein
MMTYYLSIITSSTTISFAGFSKGEVRMAAYHWLARVLVVITRWFKDMFVIFITL